MSAITNLQSPVILFDGVCNLCNRVVRFVIKRDKKNIFSFASLQSDFGQKMLKEYNLPALEFNSFLLYQNKKIYTKSTAALMVARQLRMPWNMMYVLIIIPSFIRNIFYNLIAKNRYKWFGKKEVCLIPSTKLKIRFFA